MGRMGTVSVNGLRSTHVSNGPAPGYHHTVAPIRSTVRDGATIVVGRVAGDFPGSPIELDHTFRLDGDKISSLDIG